MPLQAGMWKINVGGELAQLTISTVSPEGDVSAFLQLASGSLSSAPSFWDDDSQKLVLAFPFDTKTNQGMLLFTGFLFQDSNKVLIAQGAIAYTLVGYYIATRSASQIATAEKHTFGWYAQIGVG
jgi:hypothetical protein